MVKETHSFRRIHFLTTGIGLLVMMSVMIGTMPHCSNVSRADSMSDSLRILQLIAYDKGKIPVEDFFSTPEKTAFTISPDGKHIAYLGAHNTRLNIFIQDINGKSAPVRITNESDRDITSYFWKNNNTLLYIKDSGGDENYKLFAIQADGSGHRDLTPEKNVRIEVIDELRDFPEEVIIAMNKNNPALFEPYRLNIRTGEKVQLAENRDMANPITMWKADNNGKLRLAVRVEMGTRTHLLFRPAENAEFQSLLITDWKDMVEPLFFDETNTYIYALSNLGRDKAALVKIDPAAPERQEVILEHPDVDILSADRSPGNHRLIAAYYATDRKHVVFFDERLSAVHNALRNSFPENDIYFTGYADDEEHVIIRTYNDRTPGDFYVYDTRQHQMVHLAAINPQIDPAQMSTMYPVRFRARDSLVINGYLTLPNGGVDKNLPTVIVVHGGPTTRDYWGYRADVQLLASRGYAVFQINFRGSWGYGKKFMVAGFKQWGNEMQNDITDGVHWLIEQGISDPDRIAVYGASYGGYAALAGLAFTPDLFACGIDYVGPSNLFTLLKNLPSYWEPEKEMLYEMIGHPVKDSMMLYERSPVFHASSIRSPLFIAQGGNDPRVTKTESDQMVDALREQQVEVVYMLKNNEGHGFKLEENRLEFYKTMMGFLREYLGDTTVQP